MGGIISRRHPLMRDTTALRRECLVNPVSGRDSLAIRSSWCLVTTRGVLDQVVFGMRGPMRAARLDTPWWELATFKVAIVDMAMDTV